MASVHDFHRQRVFERYASEGLEGFQPHEILELLLFFSVPRANTNVTGHNLINEFGSLAAVFDARAEELTKVEGVGPRSAMLIRLCTDIWNRYCKDKLSKSVLMNKPHITGEYAKSLFAGMSNEAFYIICLDPMCYLMRCIKITEGTPDHVEVPLRTVVQKALDVGASQVIFCHNHPRGKAVPSPNDLLYTRRAATALTLMDIPLLDHIIVADDEYVSLSSQGAMDSIAKEVGVRIATSYAHYGD